MEVRGERWRVSKRKTSLAFHFEELASVICYTGLAFTPMRRKTRE